MHFPLPCEKWKVICHFHSTFNSMHWSLCNKKRKVGKKVLVSPSKAFAALTRLDHSSPLAVSGSGISPGSCLLRGGTLSLASVRDNSDADSGTEGRKREEAMSYRTNPGRRFVQLWNSLFLLCEWLELLEELECLRVGSVQVNSTSLEVVWFSEQAKAASLRPLHRDSSEKVRCRVSLGDWRKTRLGGQRRAEEDEAEERRQGVLLTGSDGGVSPGLSIMISFFRSSSMVLLYIRRGDRRSLSDARSRGCPNTFFEFVSTSLLKYSKRLTWFSWSQAAWSISPQTIESNYLKLKFHTASLI